MNINYLIISLLLLHNSILFCPNGNQQHNGTPFQNVEDIKGRCYCSDLCGPRDVEPEKGDAPFIGTDGICFCQQRDEDNYVKNGCKYRAKPFYKPYCKGAHISVPNK